MAKYKIENSKSKEELKYRVYRFSVKLVKYIASLPRSRESDVIGKQLLRSGTSIGANIVEAQAGSSRKEFINFYSHALKSANETKFWLCLLRDSGIAAPGNSDILNEADELSKIIGKSILTLKGK